MLTEQELKTIEMLTLADKQETARLIAEVRLLQTQLEALADAFVQQVPEQWGACIDLAPGPAIDALFEALRAAEERTTRAIRQDLAETERQREPKETT